MRLGLLQDGSARLQNMAMFDWNDLKAFLAVARGGSTLAASKALAVNQTTVARRIESLEAALSLKLFERGQSGSRLTEAGRDLMAEAEKVERAALNFDSRAKAHQRGMAGSIRITCIEILANMAVTPAIGEFRKLHPEVKVDLMVTDQTLDLQAGEADLAVRVVQTLPNSDIIARKICDYEFALYCNRDYAERMGVPESIAELPEHDLIGGDAGLDTVPAMIWMFEQAGGKAPVTRSNSMSNLVHAVHAGLGIAPLPCAIADADTRFVRCSGTIDSARATSYILMRREIKDVPRVRALLDLLVPYMQNDVKARLERGRQLREQQAANDPEAENLAKLSPSA
jgi:DNA-binding transcriptional LysR family regulator